MADTIRVLLAKPGLDGHDRGIRIIANCLVDAGMEVIYLGIHQTPDAIVEAALQEDVDAVGLSIHSGAHLTLFPKVKKLLDARGGSHILLTGGGIIPSDDMSELEAVGVGRLFAPGASLKELAQYIRDEVGKRKAKA